MKWGKGVSRAEVVWAYRMLLGREPESRAAIADNMAAADRAALRRAFLRSPEFRDAQDWPGPDLYRDVERIAVEVAAEPADLDAMLARIALAWRHFGATEPHWSVLTNDMFRSDRIGGTIDQFYESGRGDVAELLNPLSRAGLPTTGLGRVMDFGCGVGRLAFALAERADEVVGVDISPAHLALGAARAAETGVGNVRFEAIDAIGDLDRFGGFDLITTLLVLQHNPPPVIAAILARLFAALAPGGVAVFEVPTHLGGYRFSIAEYLASDQPPMEMNAIPQGEVFRIVAECGCRVLEVREDGRVVDLRGVSQVFAVRKVTPS